MRISLNGKWQFRQVGKQDYLDATVPGCNYLDLMDNKIIEDPFYKDNEQKCYWVCEEDWEYLKNFELTNDVLSSDKIILHFQELDTIAQVTFNGEVILNAENCHIAYDLDITKLAKKNNTISILFKSPVKYVLEKQKIEKCPNNCNGLTGVAHIRKPQCHFGWDWGPNLNPSGISKDVYIEYFNVARIKEVDIRQFHKDKVTVLTNATIDNFTENDSCNVSITITSPNGEEVYGKNNEEIVILNPELWYPNGMADKKTQPLYTVKVELKNGDVVLDSIEKKIGIRKLVLNQEKDQYGNNFQFIVNDEIVFCKGANWIPLDSFNARATKEIIDEYIQIALDSNFNMLRIWGGGYYESDYLYEQCDKYGIMLWQDFMFACQGYPLFMDDFRANVLREVEYNVKRLSHHPSLAIWAGNNEIEVMCNAWLLRTDYIKWNEKFFYDILPKEIVKYNDYTPYIQGTPVGSAHLKDVSSDNIGDTHLWAVWHGLQDLKYYRTRNTRFCSEFGFESLPDIKMIQSFADESDYDLNGKIFNAHQKCASGNKKMQYYITTKYRLPKNFVDYIYLSQICQSECIKDATEYWHRNIGRCNGSLYWQFNDCWPVCSWAGVDYGRNYKALQYDARHFFKNLSVSIEDTKDLVKVFVLNDKIIPQSVQVKVRLISFDGKELFSEQKEVKVDKTSSTCIFEYLVKDLKKYGNLKKAVFVCDMIEEGAVTNRKTILFRKEKDLSLPKANINVDVSIEGDKAVYKIKSDKFVRKLMLHQQYVHSPLSDNFMDLLPGEEIVISQSAESNSLEKLIEGFSHFDISRVVPLQSKFKDFIVKMKVFMIPINFGSYFYYKTL